MQPKPRILFADDDEDTRDLMMVIFQQSSYELSMTSTFRDTLNLARGGNFNLFILDSRLPDGSGIDLCKQIREFDRHTPILFYSGLAYERDRVSGLSAGAQGYLVKPVEVPVLLQTVRDLIANAGGFGLDVGGKRAGGVSSETPPLAAPRQL
jgi:DNA-binding response OmpR family regulator